MMAKVPNDKPDALKKKAVKAAQNPSAATRPPKQVPGQEKNPLDPRNSVFRTAMSETIAQSPRTTDSVVVENTRVLNDPRNAIKDWANPKTRK